MLTWVSFPCCKLSLSWQWKQNIICYHHVVMGVLLSAQPHCHCLKKGLGSSHLLLVGKEWKIRSTLGPPGITGLGKRNIAAIFWRLGWGGVKINSSLGPRAGFPLVFDGHWACIATITTERRPSFLDPTFSHCKAWAKKKKKVFYLEFYWSDPISGSGLVSFATPSVGHKIAIVNLGESLKCIVQGSISLGNQPTFFPPFRVCLLIAFVIPRVL